jgi:hypothetical protein
MPRVSRPDTHQIAGCFPEDSLADALSKVIDPDVDGIPTDIKIVGKLLLPGDLERPAAKFAGREFVVSLSFVATPTTSGDCVEGRDVQERLNEDSRSVAWCVRQVLLLLSLFGFVS